MAVTHLSRIRIQTRDGVEISRRTSTLCNRMVGAGDINCTTYPAEVTCKLCRRELKAQQARRAA